MPSTLLGEDLISTINIETIAGELDHGTHSLPFTRKWHDLNDLSGISRLLVVRPSEFLGEIQECRLRIASDKHALSSILFIVFECSVVHGDGLRTVLSWDWSMEKSLRGNLESKLLRWLRSSFMFVQAWLPSSLRTNFA